jgi:hypothetical protein
MISLSFIIQDFVSLEIVTVGIPSYLDETIEDISYLCNA